MGQHFKIVTPVYNSEQWIKKCIDSSRGQTYENFRHVIVDDCSTDNTLNIARESIKGDPRFKLVKKDSRMGAMHSHIAGAELLGREADSQDIYIHLDGDDWLAHDNVLQKVNDVYNEYGCWMTYGNYEATDGTPSICGPKHDDLMIRLHIVEGGWPFSHLRTFKKFLWDKIKNDSLLDSHENLFSSACDVAIMCPMLEMAGDRVHFIEEVLYIYNRENPLNDHKVALRDQARCALEVVQKDPYKAL